MKHKTQRQKKPNANALLCAIFAALFFVSAPITAQAQDITTGLVGHWAFDETTGTIAADSSGNSNDGSLTNGMTAAASTTNGVLENSFDFPDTASRESVDIPADATINIDTFSLSFWVNTSQTCGGVTWFNCDGFIRKADTDLQVGSGYHVLTTRNSSSVNFVTMDGSTVSELRGDIDIAGLGWVHVTVTKDAAGNKEIYINGTLDVSGSDGGLTTTNSGTLRIGQRGSNVRENYIDLMDDVRIYNRVLTPDDVQALYETAPCIKDGQGVGSEGEIIYNENYRALQYCDATDWQSIGKGASIIHGEKTIGDDYDINAVEFDSATPDYLRGTLSPTQQTKAVTGSMWLNPDGALMQIVSMDNTGTPGSFTIVKENSVSNNRITITGDNNTSTRVLRMQSTNGAPDNTWTHVLFSFDLSDPTKRHIYLNDTQETITATTYIDDFIDIINSVQYSIGAYSAGLSPYNGAIADLWIDFGTYTDLSVEANRRLFINADGQAVNLGTDGSLPTGSAPDIFLSGDTDDWHTNKGTGGGFTETGELTDSSSLPPSETAKGLIGWWRLDETSGTTIADSSGNGNDGTLSDTTGVVTYANPSPVNTALVSPSTPSDNRAVRVEVPDVFPAGTNLPFSVAMWYNRSSKTQSLWGNGASGSSEMSVSDDNLQIGIPSEANLNNSIIGEPLNEWVHYTVTYDGTTMTSYQNGTQVASAARNVVLTDDDFFFGGRQGSNGNGGADLDDVRLYNFALDADQIAELYAASSEFYEPNAVNFDGSTYLTKSNWNGGQKLTFSTWLKRSCGGGITCTNGISNYLFQAAPDPTEGCYIPHAIADKIVCVFEGGGNIISFTTGTALDDTDQWYHVMASFDLSDINKRHVYINGVEDTTTWDTFTVGSTMPVQASTRIGTRNNGDRQYEGDMSDFWLDDVYIDLSSESNRSKFIDENGAAAFLGADGSNPTGAIPDIYLSGDTATWHTNDGADGGFTENGTLTDATTAPSGAKQPRYCTSPAEPEGTLIYNSDENVMQYCDANRWVPLGPQGDGGGGCSAPSGVAGMMFYNEGFKSLIYCEGDEWIGVGRDPTTDLLAEGLIAHYRFEETSGTTVIDETGNYNGTWVNGPNVSSVSGANGNAFDFVAASNDYVEILNFNPPHQGTVVLWVNGDDYSGIRRIIGGDDAFEITEPGSFSNDLFAAGGGTIQSSTTPITGLWYHIAMTYDFTNNDSQIYVNGVLEQTGSNANDDPGGPLTLRIGHRAGAAIAESFDGRIDDVRIYDRALSAAEISSLFDLADCPNIGDVCNDGSILAGYRDYGSGNENIYMSSYQQASGTRWRDNDNAGLFADDISVDSDSDGKINHANLNTSITELRAMRLCQNLHLTDPIEAHGNTDWYLPANQELGTLFTNSASINSAGNAVNSFPSTATHWSSTESTNSTVRVRNPASFTSNKFTASVPNVRCIRRN